MGVVPTFPIGTGIQQSDLMFLLKPPWGFISSNQGQVIPNNTWTVITFTTLQHDTDPSMWSAGSPTRLTINTPGRYRIAGGVQIAANAANVRYIQIRKNAGGNINAGTFLRGSSAIPTVSLHTIVECVMDYPAPLAAGDTLEVFTWQGSGGSLSLTAADFGVGSAYLSAYWIGPV